MRIGIYDPYLDDIGGGEKYMVTIAECLSNNHTVSLFWDERKDIELIQKRFSLGLTKVRVVKNLFTRNVSFWKRWVETSKYDALIFLSDGSIPLVCSKKLFLHIQQPLPESQASSLLGSLKRRRVTSIFYNSRYTQNFNKRLFSNISSTVIYPPVGIKKREVKKENIILHVGRFRINNVVGITDFKKQSVMIDAFKEMVDKKINHGWRFIVAASVKEEDQEAFARLQQSAKNYPIDFLINKTNDSLWEVYNKAKIYWHASGFGEDLEKHPEFAEHFGISTVEAMGAGAVPVVINAGGQPEIVTDGENGFLWDTVSQLQKKTERIITDTKLLHTLSQKAELRAKDFSKQQFSQAIHTLVEK